MSDQHPVDALREKTIRDFGDQWSRFRDGHNEGHYGSVAHLGDTFGPLLDVGKLVGAHVAEIGSGPGRFVNMLLDAGVARITALEPSPAMDALKHNTRERAARITSVKALGEGLPLDAFDFVFSVGVLMHIPDPSPVVNRAFAALRPGGELLLWLYAYEGNEVYLAFAKPLRRVTTRLPDGVLVAMSQVFTAFLSAYVLLCRLVPLPRHRHMRNVMAKMTWRQRCLVIFDQLNPAFAKYYRRAEAEALLQAAGFVDVELYHRHGYSWAVRGVKPWWT